MCQYENVCEVALKSMKYVILVARNKNSSQIKLCHLKIFSSSRYKVRNLRGGASRLHRPLQMAGTYFFDLKG